MAEQSISMYSLASVVPTGTTDQLLGQAKDFDDQDPVASGVSTATTPMRVHARFVKNRSGGTLTRRQVVKWKTGYVGLGVDDAGDGEQACGVVSPYIPAAGVPDGDYFMMIYEGPAELISDGGTTLADTDIVVTAASAKVNKLTAAPADTTAALVQLLSIVGRPLAAVTNVDGTTFRAFVKFPCP